FPTRRSPHRKKPVANDSGQYLFAAVNIRKYSPANVGMAHSNQRNFLEHSEEPYNNARYCSVNARYPAVVHGADIVMLMRYILQWYPAYECICVDVYLCVCESDLYLRIFLCISVCLCICVCIIFCVFVMCVYMLDAF